MASYLLIFAFSVLAGSGQNVGAIAPDEIPASDKGLTITASETEIIPNMTDHLKVTCKYSKPENSQIVSVMSLVLSYWDNVTRGFKRLIMVTSVNPHKVKVLNDVGATTSGDLDQNGDSFLTMEWNYPDKDVATRYMCSVNTMGALGSPFTTKVAVQISLDSNDVASLAKEMLALKKELVEQKKEQEDQNKQLEDQNKQLDKQLKEQKKKQEDQNKQLVEQKRKLEEQKWKIEGQRKEVDALKSKSVPINDTGVLIDHQRVYWINRRLTFERARLMCLITGGKLAELTFLKLKAAESDLKAAGWTVNGYWVGVRREGDSKPWVWDSNGKEASIFMKREQPSGDHCILFYSVNDEYHAWPCTNEAYPLCTRS